MTEEQLPGDFLLQDDDGELFPSLAEAEFLTPSEGDRGLRLDVYLSKSLGLSRSFTKKLIDGGRVALVPPRPLKAGMKTTPEMTLQVAVPPPETSDLIPEDIPFTVIYEDSSLVVIDKPGGLVVHPAPGNRKGTLVHGLLYRFKDMGPFDDPTRPGVVHRLDGPTSGLLVAAKNQFTLEALQGQFKKREVGKEYIALVRGNIKQSKGIIDAPLGRDPANRLKMAAIEGGKAAVTRFKRLWTRGGYSLVHCAIPTGRTHQIRVHLSSIGRPIVGDGLYGSDRGFEALEGRIFLHSWRLTFTHPNTGKTLRFTSYLPTALTELLREILSTCRG